MLRPPNASKSYELHERLVAATVDNGKPQGKHYKWNNAQRSLDGGSQGQLTSHGHLENDEAHYDAVTDHYPTPTS
jgi:hypothetical protein